MEGVDRFIIVETDNFGGDYPDEKRVNLPSIRRKEDAHELCKMINKLFCNNDFAPRYWKVENHDYKLQPGFEP